MLKANICRKFSNVPNNFREWSGGPVALWRSGGNPESTGPGNRTFSPPFFFFFARIGRSDLTKKLEKVGPFECDELEKHCRVSAKCYPTKVPALYTMTKEKFKSVFLVLLLVSRQTKSQLLMINKLVPIK